MSGLAASALAHACSKHMGGGIGPPHLPSFPCTQEQPFPSQLPVQSQPPGSTLGPRFCTAPSLGGHLAADLELAQNWHRQRVLKWSYSHVIPEVRDTAPSLWEAPACLILKKEFLFCLHFYNWNRGHFSTLKRCVVS